MRSLLSILMCMFILIACANNTNLKKQNLKDVKKELINNANNGNTEAMIELSKVYLFPQTKEGLELYNKWYDLILQSKDIDNIINISAIFQTYNKMFINGEEKYEKILERAVDLGSQKALYKLSFNLLRKKQDNKLKKLAEKIIKEKNQDKLITLHNIYLFSRQKDEMNQIKKLITKSSKEYFNSLSLADKLYYTHLAYLQPRNKGREYQEITKETINSNDPKLIAGMGNLLFDDARWYKAKAYLEKAVKLNDKDSLTHLNLANEYKILDNYKHKYKDKILMHLTKAALLDNYKATKQLLQIYKKENNTQAYLDLKEKILNLNESKRALADFYYKNNRINEGDKLLNELALKNNVEAIITLAQAYKGKEFNPEKNALIDKWKNYVLNSEEVYLRQKVKPSLIYKEDEKFKEKIIQKQVENNNITVLKDLAQDARSNFYSRKDKPISFLEKAASFGDVESKYLLADQNSYYGEDAKKRISIYKELLKQGDKRAYKELGIAYGYAPSGNTKEDVNKSLYYYKKAYENGDKSVLEDIIVYYICPDCPTYNEKQAKIYINQAIKDKNAELVYNLGGSYKQGKPVKKDLKKAEKYYRKAFELGYAKAYFSLADIYENEYKNEKEALNLIQECAKKYEISCRVQLGFYYQEGIGVKKDIDKAMTYYKEYAHSNNTAAYNLGYIYVKRKDYKNGIKYMERAYSLKRDKDIAYYIAWVYHKGKGSIKKDLKLAKKWYKRANTKKAKEALKKLANRK